MSNDLGFTPAPEYDENADDGVQLRKNPPPGTAPGAPGTPGTDPYGPPPTGAPFGAPAVNPNPYGAPPPGVPSYGAQPGVQPGSYVARRQSGKAIAALVCGIASFMVGLLLGVFALPISIAALVLGILARKEIETDPTLDGGGMALAGLIMGIIGIVLSILGIIAIALFFSSFETTY